MPRYIDTDDFKKQIKPYDTDDPVDKAMYNFALNKMLCTPTADVVERKKGEWLEKQVFQLYESDFELQSCKCSVCGRYHTQPYMYFFSEPHFCSWCGSLNGEETDEK